MEKNNYSKKGWGHGPSGTVFKHKALSSNSSITKKRKKRKRNLLWF
jgi:hypothetical protein